MIPVVEEAVSSVTSVSPKSCLVSFSIPEVARGVSLWGARYLSDTREEW